VVHAAGAGVVSRPLLTTANAAAAAAAQV
jgi:hypothetical protein